jgi:DNA polymerase-3 subunit epsilon/CBS domain-containing protein
MNTFMLATPLMALNAVALDTEATSLNPARARLVEFGAIHINHGEISALDSDGILVTRINPGEPIPASATQIHGIDDAMVRDAEPFGTLWPRIAQFLGHRPWIGQSIGYDITLIEAECKRAGLSLALPYALDTRLLAQKVAPNLAGYSLETLCRWLNVPLEKRHSAIGDAAAALHVFKALVPLLREIGIRTLGEALRASMTLSDATRYHETAGWNEGATIQTQPVAASVAAPSLMSAISHGDAYAYRHKVSDVMSSPPILMAARTSLSDAIEHMTEAQCSSVFVIDPEDEKPLAKRCGILTERDALRVLAKQGAYALERPISDFSTRHLQSVAADAPLYVAIGRMTRLRIRHLAVHNARGEIVGALSARDLLRARDNPALALGDAISMAADSHAMAAAWVGLSKASASLLVDGSNGRDVAAMISYEIRTLTARAAELSEAKMAIDGHGPPPCAYALFVLGSAARGESLLAMDQDNALVFEHGEPGDAHDRWFEKFARHCVTLLDEAGVPLCKGGIMVKNPQWRGSLAHWRDRIEHWVARASMEDLLSVDAFFDMHFCYGNAALWQDFHKAARELTRERAAFAKLLADANASHQSGLTLFNRFRALNGRLDLKRYGLFPIVCMARIIAIMRGYETSSTQERLSRVRAEMPQSAQDIDAIIDAQGLFLTLIARQQVLDSQAGIAPSNTIEIARLSTFERIKLKNALAAPDVVDDLTRDLLFKF